MQAYMNLQGIPVNLPEEVFPTETRAHRIPDSYKRTTMLEDFELQTIVQTIFEGVDERLGNQAKEFQSQLDTVRVSVLERFEQMLVDSPTAVTSSQLWQAFTQLLGEFHKLADHTGYVDPDRNTKLSERIRLIRAGAARPEPALSEGEKRARRLKQQLTRKPAIPASTEARSLPDDSVPVPVTTVNQRETSQI
jgi:hypothetical protein